MTVRRSAARSGATAEIALTLVAILVAAGLTLNRRPHRLPSPPDAERLAAHADGEPSADVLVVLPAVATAHTVDQWSTDEAWLNTVEREIGTFRTVEAGSLTRSALDPCAWVIVPRRAAGQLDPTQTQFVRNWVEDGGVLLVERPEGPWRAIVGEPSTAERLRETRRITSFDGAISRGDLRADILDFPLATTLALFAPSNLSRGRDFFVLLEVDGLPGVVSIPIGRGLAIVVLFDFTGAVVRTMQGVPPADLASAAGDDTLILAADRVADDALRTSLVPFVDILERNLLYLLDVHRPVGRLWYFPAQRRGALLVGHSEAWAGQAADYMTGWERAQQQPGTLFTVATSLTPEALARFGRAGTDLQLGWVPAAHPAAPTRSWGAGAFHPLLRPMSLLEQADQLNEDLVPYGPIVATRSLDTRWPSPYFAGFRALEAAGVQLDASYGPPPAWLSPAQEQSGYLFGTGRAFRPIDQSGTRFRLREVPVTLDSAATGYALPLVRRAIVDSAERYHTVIAADWRPDVMLARPSFDAIDGWQQAFAWSESQDLWVASYAEFADFLARRDASHVESRFSREERRLTIEARLAPPGGTPSGDDTSAPSLAFPTRFDGRPVDRLIVDNVSTDVAALAVTGDRVLHLLALPPGDHRVQVIYGSPLDAAPGEGGPASPDARVLTPP